MSGELSAEIGRLDREVDRMADSLMEADRRIDTLESRVSALGRLADVLVRQRHDSDGHRGDFDVCSDAICKELRCSGVLP